MKVTGLPTRVSASTIVRLPDAAPAAAAPAASFTSTFEAPKLRAGPALIVPQTAFAPLTAEQRRELEYRLVALKGTLEQVQAALARADQGQPAFGAIRESLETLPEKLKYEIARVESQLKNDVGPYEMTPFVKQEIETAHEWLGQLDWFRLDQRDHGIAEGLDMYFDAVFEPVPAEWEPRNLAT